VECYDVDAGDPWRYTPLAWAAREEYKGGVKMLPPGTVVNPDGLNNYGRALLLYPAWDGHEGAVRIPLERDEVDPAGADNCIKTCLAFAARWG